MCGFVVIWIGLGLCLMFAVGVRSFKLSLVFLFLHPLLSLGFPKYCSSERVFQSFQLRSTVIVLVSYWCGAKEGRKGNII